MKSAMLSALFLQKLEQGQGGLRHVILLAVSCRHGDIRFQAWMNIGLSWGTAFQFAESNKVIFSQVLADGNKIEKVQSQSIQS